VELCAALHSIDSMGNFRPYDSRFIAGLAEFATAARARIRRKYQGDLAMKKLRMGFAGCYLVALLLAMTAYQAAAQDANFVGTWDMTVTGGGQGGGGNRGGGGGAQTLTITKDGDKFKVTHKSPRGDNTSDATVSGSTISWTEQRQGRDGDTMKIEFKATLDGDALKGTMGGGQYSREFAAKRSN
jgi:hypothetical protein